MIAKQLDPSEEGDDSLVGVPEDPPDEEETDDEEDSLNDED